jgi:hypothetical protein
MIDPFSIGMLECTEPIGLVTMVGQGLSIEWCSVGFIYFYPLDRTVFQSG